ncbi:MAG: RidA family protein [Burkholderiaceae bacterium]
MNDRIEFRLAQLGIVLPVAPRPAGSYRPWVLSQGIVHLSGQTARVGGQIAYAGKVGGELTLEQGREAARICAINLLSQLKAACAGRLERVERCIRISGFVASHPSFIRQPAVIDAASDLLIEVFGEAGRHARSAIGVAVLPSDSAVEIEALFAVTSEASPGCAPAAT